jgi:hypothetical protein
VQYNRVLEFSAGFRASNTSLMNPCSPGYTGRARTSLDASDPRPAQKRDGDPDSTVMTFENVRGKAALALGAARLASDALSSGCSG